MSSSWNRAAPGLALAALLALSGCGDELLGEEVGCNWITGENCWKASLQVAASCLPPETSVGQLAANGSDCLYPDGYRVVFHRPVDMQNLKGQLWDFSLEKDGTPCLSYAEESLDRRRLVTAAGTYLEEVKNVGVQFTCPDGHRYKVVDVRLFATCTDYLLHTPGLKVGWDEREVALGFAGTGAEPLRSFTCRLSP